jgi:hypothetical protein
VGCHFRMFFYASGIDRGVYVERMRAWGAGPSRARLTAGRSALRLGTRNHGEKPTVPIRGSGNSLMEGN